MCILINTLHLLARMVMPFKCTLLIYISIIRPDWNGYIPFIYLQYTRLQWSIKLHYITMDQIIIILPVCSLFNILYLLARMVMPFRCTLYNYISYHMARWEWLQTIHLFTILSNKAYKWLVKLLFTISESYVNGYCNNLLFY